MYSVFDGLIGAIVKEIYISEEYLYFVTSKGDFCYLADGDCCSRSYLYDFIGVRHLLDNGEIRLVDYIPKEFVTPPTFEEIESADYLQVYGYRIVTIHPKFGEVSSLFSFRNNSNGYYGGQIEISNRKLSELNNMQRITSDWTVNE